VTSGSQASTGARGAASAAVLARALPGLRGKGELARRLMMRAERRGRLGGEWRMRMKDGTRMELPLQSRMTWAAAFDGVYDPAAMAHVAEFVRAQELVLDVGASLGLWTVPLGALARARDARVWAFEPNPANIEWIERNVALNGLKDTVTIRNIGLGDRAEQVTLASAEYGIGNGVVAVDDAQGTEKFPRMPVAIERLDDVELPGPVSFVKIDTEGYEAAFLRGAARTIERDRPVIFGEFEPYWLGKRGEDLGALLAGMDYEVFELHPTRSHAWRSIDTVQRRRVTATAGSALPANLLLLPR
jgi:FkbM family methyltransferase